ncbi:ABC transporter permease [Nonomuraea sp. LPB2021202275-12-8]|uniref:ABC transporter permease n=1 Tax=Nonomuraea sp. LPB2021202275-12-8 TaxID=3120159 RepID=UPI00300D8FF8
MGALIVTELKLLSRSIEFLVIAILFPAVFFLIMSEVFGNLSAGSLDMVTYMMISMVAFGAISGAISVGQRVAPERQAGWNRQLRLTPLPGWSYVASKVVVSLVIVLPAVVLILAAGFLIKGVELSLTQWGLVLLAAWLGSLPFGVLGLLIGLAVKPDAVGAVYVAAFLMLALFGGLWVPVEILPGFMGAFAHALPSFWLAEQARNLATGGGLDLLGVLVSAAWFFIAGALVVMLYKRDAARV